MSRRYRNRRVGDFLKELDLTEGRGTGIPKIRRALEQNGSPIPVIETDVERTSFLIRIPIHPEFEAQVKAQVDLDLNETEKRVLLLLHATLRSNQDLVRELGYSSLSGNLKRALQRLTELGLIDYTITDPVKRRSRNQQRCITSKGAEYV